MKEERPRKAFLSWNGTEQRSSHLLTDTQNKLMKPRYSGTPFTAAGSVPGCWLWSRGGRSWRGCSRLGWTPPLYSSVRHAELKEIFAFHFFFFLSKSWSWYKADFRNTSIRFPVTGNSASRCLAILAQHRDWGRGAPVGAAVGRLAESRGARAAASGSASPVLPSLSGERSSISSEGPRSRPLPFYRHASPFEVGSCGAPFFS